MSEVKVNKISPRSGTDVTLGDSGDTFTIPSGATINNQGTAVNFGATGSASWNTTVKTSTFTAVAGEGYFVNTTGGAVTVNLPAGVAGAVVAIKDYAGTFDTNAVTLVQNGSDKIGGKTVNATLDTEGIAVTLVFIDSTQGWLVTDSGLQDEAPTAQYITATGGTITTVCTNFKVHTFTGPGTFTVCSAGNACGSNTVDYLVIGGGGSSSQGGPSTHAGGGGGAGGYRFSNGTASGCYSAGPSPLGASALPVSAQSYSIAVGAGGARVVGCSQQPGLIGAVSTFSTITSAGGGAGRMTTGTIPSGPDSANGGSGGGGAGPWPGSNTSIPGGAGNTPPVSPSQGNPGGTTTTNNNSGGSGGGAGGAGSATPGDTYGGDGGIGLASSITGAAVTRGGGGGGSGLAGKGGAAGPGGGGAGGTVPNTPGVAGTVNTGGGAGAGASKDPPGSQTSYNAAGGSGIVIIRYKFQN